MRTEDSMTMVARLPLGQPPSNRSAIPIIAVALLLPLFHACADEPATGPSFAQMVQDLTVTSATTRTVTLRWTQVDGGDGNPAWYQLRYSTPPIDWNSATIGCEPTLEGDHIGAEMSCTVEGLEAGTSYDFQVMSFLGIPGTQQGAVHSNVATGATEELAQDAGVVGDLAVTGATESSLTVSWTEVDDGSGQPASYTVKYAVQPLVDWQSAGPGCDVDGIRIGGDASCTVNGLEAATTYDLQILSYRNGTSGPEGAAYSEIITGATLEAQPGDAAVVTDLIVASATASSLSLAWTQVDDGTGQPAEYRIKYAAQPLTDWQSATLGCDVGGTRIGGDASCIVSGLEAGTTYDLQVMSYREGSSGPEGAAYSEIVTGRTESDQGVEHSCLIAAASVELASPGVFEYSFESAGHAINASGVAWVGAGEEDTLVELVGSQEACFSGGAIGTLIDGGMPEDAMYECTTEHCGGACPAPCFAYHSAAALGPNVSALQIIEDIEMRSSGDGVSLESAVSRDAVVRRVYAHDLHDDAFESDFGLAGFTIEESLVDRVNTAFAMRLRSSANGDQRNMLWAIRDNLVRLHEFPNGYKQRPGHGHMFKLDETLNEPRFRITGNVFVVGPDTGGSNLFPPLSRVEECADNTYLFLGTQALWEAALEDEEIEDGGNNGQRLAALNERFSGCFEVRVRPASMTEEEFLAAEGWFDAVDFWKAVHVAGANR